jgi:hypothetical protein
MGTNGYVTPAHVVDREAERAEAPKPASVRIEPSEKPAPAQAPAASVTNHFKFEVHGTNGEDIAQKIARTLERQMSRSSQLAIDGRRIR